MIIAWMLSLLMAIVIYLDARTFTIPNWLNGLVFVLFFPVALMSPMPVDWLGSLMAFGVVFAIGFLIFSFRLMGGGDIKLLCALSPWCGWWEPLLRFITYTALYGGLLSLVVLCIRFCYPWIANKREDWRERPIPRLLTHGEPAPYGLAIAAAILTMLWINQLPLVPLI